MAQQQVETIQLLAQGAPELGLSLDASQLQRFEVYYRELADWNDRMNLTSVIDYGEVQVKHFLDSLTLLPALSHAIAPDARVIDIGAGAGFPGLPLKLVCPAINLALVESTGKKANFLRHVVETLALTGVDVHTGRAEDLAHRPELRASYNLTLARGLARLPTLLEYTLPFTRTGGLVAAWKHGGDGLKAELAFCAKRTTSPGWTGPVHLSRQGYGPRRQSGGGNRGKGQGNPRRIPAKAGSTKEAAPLGKI